MKHLLKINPYRTLSLGLERVPETPLTIPWLNYRILSTKLISRFRQRFGDGPCNVRFLGRTFSLPDYATFSSELTDIFISGRDYFKADTPMPSIVDIGANVGFGTFYFKLLYPKSVIRNYEADPSTFAHLKRNTADMVGVHSHHAAVGDGALKTLYRAATSLSATTIESIMKGGEHIEVPGVRLSDILDSEIDLLKIDCEGAEYEIMREAKAKLHMAKRIFMEVHAVPGESIPALLKTIEDAGFDVYVIETAMTHAQVLEGNTSYRLEVDCIRA